MSIESITSSKPVTTLVDYAIILVRTLYRHSKWVIGCFFLIALFLPFVSGDYLENLLIYVLIYTVSVIGYDFTTGGTNEIHVAQAPMMAIGGYTSAILMMKFQIPFFAAALAAIGLTIAFGLFISYPSIRIHGLYFAIITLTFGELVRIVIANTPSITGGTPGLTPIPDIAFLGFELSRQIEYYYLALAIVVLAMTFKYRLSRSNVGHTFQGVRNNEHLAKTVGINTLKYKMYAFTLNAVFAATAGILFAHYIGLMIPREASLLRTTDFLVMNLIGGIGTIWGPVIGAFFVVGVPEYFRIAGSLRLFMFGLTLIVFILLIPRGLAGIVQDLRYQGTREDDN